MDRKLTPELKKLKEEFDFLHQKIGELEWKRATKFYGRKAIFDSEIDKLETQLNNYVENMSILVERIADEVRRANQNNS